MAFARSCGFHTTDLRDIEIAVGESLANAIEHGNQMRGSFSVSARFTDGMLTVEVSDEGAGFTPADSAVPNPYRGWGILLMRSAVDHLSFHDGGATVRLEKRLAIRSDELGESRQAEPGTE